MYEMTGTHKRNRPSLHCTVALALRLELARRRNFLLPSCHLLSLTGAAMSRMCGTTDYKYLPPCWRVHLALRDVLVVVLLVLVLLLLLLLRCDLNQGPLPLLLRSPRLAEAVVAHRTELKLLLVRSVVAHCRLEHRLSPLRLLDRLLSGNLLSVQLQLAQHKLPLLVEGQYMVAERRASRL